MCRECLLPRLLSLLVAIMALPVAYAQSVDQWTAWGDASMTRGEYYGASRFYAGALELEPGRMALQWKQAEACRLSHQYDKAAELYATVHRKDMGRTHPDALRWLGEMQLCMGDYQEAERTWNKVLQKEKDKRSVVALRAANALEGIKLERSFKERPDTLVLEHLPSPVNTYDSEFGGRLGPDSALYFSSLRGELNDDEEVIDTAAYRTVILSSQKSGDAWGDPRTWVVNGIPGHSANPAWTAGGQRMLFTFCPDGGVCRIHSAPGTGTELTATPIAGLGEEPSTQPCVVRWKDKDLLFFVSDRTGGPGGSDIWWAELRDGGAVDVRPLGSNVNTPGNERTPWFDAATGTLWFSSDFHPGLGGYDIFRSTWTGSTFGPPANAGTPINGPANDLYPAIYPDRGEGWITSNRKGSFAAKGETCCNDLYRWRTTPAPVAAMVPKPIPADTTEVMRRTVDLVRFQDRFPLKLYFHNDEPEPRSWATRTGQAYGTTYQAYMALLPIYLREQTDTTAIGTFFRNEVTAGHARSLEMAEALRDELEHGASLTLEVRGHASPLARNAYNTNLSMRRIASLENFLRSWNGGVLASYLDGTASNGARLGLRILPFGEDRSAAGVSDDLGDLKHSVYSVEAARERRIEVVAVEWTSAGEQGPRSVQKTGELRQGAARTFTFHVENKGATALRLLGSKADCGCTTASLPDAPIPPGGMADVEVIFNGRAPEGPLRRTVVIDTDGTPATIELVIEGTVVP
jgi:hypothetical protein